MEEVVLNIIACCCASAGAVMLLLPGAVPRIEEVLNRDVGEREIFALRFGLPAERRVEERLNASVLMGAVVWDQALHRHSRVTGTALCGIALLHFVLAS